MIGTTATIGDNRVEISVVNLFEEIHCFSCLVATKREREQIITFDIYIIFVPFLFLHIYVLIIILCIMGKKPDL